MTSTALHSDYVLPAAAWYERTEHKWVTPLMPFIHAGEKAVELPRGEVATGRSSRCSPQAVDQRRRDARHRRSSRTARGRERSFVGLYDRSRPSGEFGPTDDEKVAAALIEKREQPRRRELGGAQEARLGALHGRRQQHRVDRQRDADHSRTTRSRRSPTTSIDKKPYPTLSRRIQFYLDQELYLEMGEAAAGAQGPADGGRRLSAAAHRRPHALEHPLGLARRQADAAAAARRAGHVHERRGCGGARDPRRRRACASSTTSTRSRSWPRCRPACGPGQLIIYHAWENFQFRASKGFQNLIPTPLNPVELAGGQFHLRPMTICLQPSHTDRDTRVEVAPRMSSRVIRVVAGRTSWSAAPCGAAASGSGSGACDRSARRWRRPRPTPKPCAAAPDRLRRLRATCTATAGPGTASSTARTRAPTASRPAPGTSSSRTASPGARSRTRSTRPPEPGVPDFNPRGCQKGACYTHLMYEPSRVLHPLRRVGERGSGSWKRMSWDEALGEIADAMHRRRRSSRAPARSSTTTAPPTSTSARTPRGEMRLFRILNATVDRLLGRRRRHAHGRRADLGHVQRRGHLGRLVQVRLHHGLGRQPGLHAHSRDPLHARGALSGRQVRRDRARLQRDRRARRLPGSTRAWAPTRRSGWRWRR